MIPKLCFTLLFLVYKVEGQCEVAQECVTDFTEESCDSWQTLAYNSTIFGCCPSCVDTVEEIDVPGVVVEEGCKAPSNCLSDGSYGPVQCKGDYFTGRCFCVDRTGKRIFGQMWRDQADDMTCACSRQRTELDESGRKDVTLHCNTDGSFETLQCDDGMCWCAEPKTGQPTAGPIPDTDMKILPCYSLGVTGSQYLRQCESQVHAEALISQEQSEHGTNFAGASTLYCDYDGSYGPYQLLYSSMYCTNRDASILGSWQAQPSEVADMECNCARDSVIYYPERGMTLTYTCMANGNYEAKQTSGDTTFCIDSDGYFVKYLDNAQQNC